MFQVRTAALTPVHTCIVSMEDATQELVNVNQATQAHTVRMILMSVLPTLVMLEIPARIRLMDILAWNTHANQQIARMVRRVMKTEPAYVLKAMKVLDI